MIGQQSEDFSAELSFGASSGFSKGLTGSQRAGSGQREGVCDAAAQIRSEQEDPAEVGLVCASAVGVAASRRHDGGAGGADAGSGQDSLAAVVDPHVPPVMALKESGAGAPPALSEHVTLPPMSPEIICIILRMFF